MTAWMLTTSGRAVDLVDADLSRIDVEADIAWPLAGILRFSGHGRRPAGGLSVGQHCVLGAEALLAETGSPTVALAFLVHDAHEAFLGDLTTPSVQAIEARLAALLRAALGGDAIDRIGASLGSRAPLRLAVEATKAALDEKIHLLAGLPARLPSSIRAAVAEMDLRMLDAERRLRLPRVVDPIGEAIWPEEVRRARPVRLRGGLSPWPRARVCAAWMERFEAWRLTRPVTPESLRRTAAKV